MTQENDIVLIYVEEQAHFFARIETITPDSKPDWFHVKLLVLQVPLQVTTWILKDVYIGGESFTMNDKRVRLEKVACPEEVPPESTSPKEKSGNAKVISLKDLKRKKSD